MYQTMTLAGMTFILRVADHAVIPTTSLNSDYQEYLLWLAAGNVAPETTP